MHHIRFATLLVTLMVIVTGCATATPHGQRAAKMKQYEQTSAAMERAHRVRAWRSADAFALGSD